MNEICFNRLNESILNIDKCLQNTKCPKECVDLLFTEFNKYKEIISDFFTGKENDIKSLYRIIKNETHSFNKISYIDVNHGNHLYSEYSSGMLGFVKKMIEIQDTQNINIEAVKNKLEMISKKDCDFRISILGGERNAKTTGSISEAMVNIEVLIDINNDFDNYIKVLEDLLVKINKENKYINLITCGIKLYVKSICSHYNECIKLSLNTYSKLNESIKKKTHINGVIKKPEFQLF
jgi:hypothetical protein